MSDMDILERYKDTIMTYLPIGLLIIIFLGMIASQLSGCGIRTDIFKSFTFGLENQIKVIG